MNAHAPIEDGSLSVDFDLACARLNAWRGQMVENFARCEQAVTETLAHFYATDAAAKTVKFPHLVGQRYDRLTALLSGPVAQTGYRKVALAAIERFRSHDGVRAMLCHGVTKVAIDRAGECVALMTLTGFKGGATTSDRSTILEREGGAILADLMDGRRRVCAALGQVRRERGAIAQSAQPG